jgi:hypothetical protein
MVLRETILIRQWLLGNFYNSSSESYETSLYFEIVFKKQ